MNTNVYITANLIMFTNWSDAELMELVDHDTINQARGLVWEWVNFAAQWKF